MIDEESKCAKKINLELVYSLNFKEAV